MNTYIVGILWVAVLVVMVSWLFSRSKKSEPEVIRPPSELATKLVGAIRHNPSRFEIKQEKMLSASDMYTIRDRQTNIFHALVNPKIRDNHGHFSGSWGCESYTKEDTDHIISFLKEHLKNVSSKKITELLTTYEVKE